MTTLERAAAWQAEQAIPMNGNRSVPVLRPEAFTKAIDPQEQARKAELTTKLEKSRILVTDTHTRAQTILSICEGETRSPAATLGNLSLVKAKAKQGKTFFIGMVIAACLKRDAFQGRIKGCLPDGKRRVLLFDTEQSKYHVWKRLKGIDEMADFELSANLEVYSLREYSTAERLEMIGEAMTGEGIGLVVIDGVRDLVFDINDPKECSEIKDNLLQWSTLADCHIMTILHENKGDGNARGHLGTEVVNKAETVWKLTRDPKTGFITVEPEMTRDKDFPAFMFRITENGLPEILELQASTEGEGKGKFDPYRIQPERHKDVLEAVFSKSKEYNRPDFISALRVEWQAYSQSLGSTNAAGDYVQYLVKMGWVKIEGLNGKPARWVLVT